MENILNATVAEALALLKGLDLIEKLGCASVAETGRKQAAETKEVEIDRHHKSIIFFLFKSHRLPKKLQDLVADNYGRGTKKLPFYHLVTCGQ